MEDCKGVLTEARELVEEYAKVQVTELVEPETGVKALAVLGSLGVQPVPREIFDAYRNAPRRRAGTAQLTKIESFIEHVNRFKDGNSVLFAIDDRSSPSLTAVLDYHEAPNGVIDSAGEVVVEPNGDAPPRFGMHHSDFAFPLSDPWKAWVESDATPMNLRDFAKFLEDRIIDVIDMIPGEDDLPEELAKYVRLCGGIIGSSSKLVELSRGFTVHEKGQVEEKVNINTGEVTFNFVSEHVGANGQKLSIPNVFLIAIPVFKYGMLYRLAARLRYRKTPAGMTLWYELYRADAAFDAAFGEACERVQVETELPLLFGRPE